MTGLTAWTAGADVLGTYTFAGSDPGGDLLVPTATNLTFSPFTRVNLQAEGAPDAFRSSLWTAGGSRDTGEYVEFILTPATGHVPDFTTLGGERVTVRLFGWNAGHQNGRLDQNNVTVEGSVSLVPEPSPALLFCGGVLLFMMRCATTLPNR